MIVDCIELIDGTQCLVPYSSSYECKIINLRGANNRIGRELLNPPYLTCILSRKHFQLKHEVEIGGANSRINTICSSSLWQCNHCMRKTMFFVLAPECLDIVLETSTKHYKCGFPAPGCNAITLCHSEHIVIKLLRQC